jgi:hypothetical protein
VVGCLTFPDNDDAPTQASQLPPIPGIARNVVLELVGPESAIAFGCVGEAATSVPVPEAPVYEDNHAMSRKHNIGASRQSLFVHSEAKPKAVEDRSDDEFGLRVTPADARHVPAPVLTG